MKFSELVLDHCHEIKSKYDLAAYCYCYIRSVISNQNIFLGDYIKINQDAEQINPNYEMLNNFAMKIKSILEQNPFQVFSTAAWPDETASLILSAENSLQDFGNRCMNLATVPFYILKGIDLYFKDCDYKTFKTAPLNNCCKDFCLVYVNTNSSWMEKISMEKNYPDIIHTNEIRNYFQHIIILEMCELPDGYGKPGLITLHKERKNMEKIIESGRMKVALIPAMQNRWFEFAVKRGASFEIVYDHMNIKNVTERLIALLKQAIACEVNMIVFPEYICNEEIQLEIQKTLARMSMEEPENLEELLLVVAGSGWTNDSDNVSCLYSYDGYLLGKVYKYSAYNNVIDGKEYVERLMNPGKEITLVEIPGAGIIQTEICRNVSENEFCLKLARVFGTHFLLIAAWSTSVNIGFKKQMDSIISANHNTCFAMSNCCAAFCDNKKFRSEISIVSAPQKNGSLIEGNYEYIRRDEQMCRCCENGCIFLSCFDFNGEEQKDVKITVSSAPDSASEGPG